MVHVSTVIHARRSRDCARELRVRYRLPEPVSEAFLGHGPADATRVERFSQMVAGARDHFEIDFGPVLTVAGSIGDRDLVARFRRGRGAEVGLVVAAFDASLARWGYGTVVHG